MFRRKEGEKLNFAEFQKKRRVELMPSGGKLAEMAQRKCAFTPSQIKSDFNNCLKQLMDIELKLYEQTEKE